METEFQDFSSLQNHCQPSCSCTGCWEAACQDCSSRTPSSLASSGVQVTGSASWEWRGKDGLASSPPGGLAVAVSPTGGPGSFQRLCSPTLRALVSSQALAAALPLRLVLQVRSGKAQLMETSILHTPPSLSG